MHATIANVYWIPESIERFTEDQAFLPSYDLAPPQPPSLCLSRQEARPATHRKTEKERQLPDRRVGEGVREEPNHTTARKPGLQ
jgi:hypothetical protein